MLQLTNEGDFKIFSRNLEDSTHRWPDVVEKLKLAILWRKSSQEDTKLDCLVSDSKKTESKIDFKDTTLNELPSNESFDSIRGINSIFLVYFFALKWFTPN